MGWDRWVGFVFFSATYFMSGRFEMIEALVWFGDLPVMLNAPMILVQPTDNICCDEEL